MITDAWKNRHTNGHFRFTCHLLCVDRIFGFKIKRWYPRDYTQHRNTRAFFKPIDTRLQQGQITAKPIDEKTFYALLFTVTQEFKRSDQMGKRTTAINVGD